jgi:F0F1-type ATP synthase assembly protein I
MAKLTPADERRYWLRYAGMGFEFFAGLLACVLIGMWLDSLFGWSPWGVLVGAAVGLFGSMFNLIRRGLAMQREVSDQQASKRQDPNGS